MAGAFDGIEHLVMTAGPPPVDTPNRAPARSGEYYWEKCADWTSGPCNNCDGLGGVYWLKEGPDDDGVIAVLCPACMKNHVDEDNRS